jgi:DNA transposition AAA+ family ATPase
MPLSHNHPPEPNPRPLSSGTATSDPTSPPDFVETLEYRRFAEFCDACRRYQYIGLCYGPPGVGKTLSARHYSRWDEIEQATRWTVLPHKHETILYTPAVVNSPGVIRSEVDGLRGRLRELARRPTRLEADKEREQIRQRDKAYADSLAIQHDWLTGPPPQLMPTYGQVDGKWAERLQRIGDPTTLIVIDEADRMRMASLEQVRAIFDAGSIGLILVGMPGLEKRLARYAQFYSRIGFVHEFRPLGTAEIRCLFEEHWAPAGVKLPQNLVDAEVLAGIIRITGGNFRLLNRLMAQIERILEINGLREVTKAAVDAARESLVIGHV